MSTHVLERKAARIREKAQMVHEESDALSRAIPEPGAALHSLSLACTSLGYLWRSLVDDVCADIDIVELRDLAAPLRQHAAITVNCCDVILSLAHAAEEDVDELLLVRHEMGDVVAWLANWPDHDSSNRDAARAAIAAGKFVSDEELLAMG